MNKILEIRNLKKYFYSQRSWFFRRGHPTRAVDDVSFTIEKAKTLGLVGESGCGKSTLGRLVLRLVEPTAGNIVFDGEDITQTKQRALRPLRQKMQFIFQDPYASLNPRLTVYETLREPMDVHRFLAPQERDPHIRKMLDIVGLGSKALGRFPHEFSGGQRQRIGIARALIMRPSFIVADEPVSALDVSVQAQVLNLIRDLQREFSLSFLFIAHNLAVVQHISDEVAVMYLGKIVEKASSANLYKSPKHPYTQMLLAAVPQATATARNRPKPTIIGEVPSSSKPPAGCPFHPRCPFKMDRCSVDVPVLRERSENGDSHMVSCHLE